MSDEAQSARGALPQYQCHKKVWALKIRSVSSNGLTLTFDDERFAPRAVTRHYLEKHQPQAGGYWVQYDDGYESFSPAEAFESGYSLITGRTATAASAEG